jgi:branched-chain amino acid transport system permease protein
LTKILGFARSESGIAIIIVWLLGVVAATMLNSYWVAIAISTLLWIYLCVSWNVLGGVLGQVSFGNSVFFGIGAYTSTYLTTVHGVSPFLGMLVGGVIAALVGLAIGYLPFGWHLGKLTFALLTLAVAYAFEFTVAAVPALGRNNGLFLQTNGTGFWDFGAHDPRWPLAILLVFVTAIVLCVHVMLRSRLGFYWRAIQQNEMASEAGGIDLFRAKQIALVFTAFTTALVGTVQAQYVGFIDPESMFGVGITIQILLFTVVGGAGSVIGPVIGPLLLVPLAELLRLGLSADYAPIQPAIYGALLVAVILLWPSGLAGILQRLLGNAGSYADVLLPREALAGAKALTPMEPGHLVEVTALTKQFGGVRALDKVDFHVDAGEIVGVIGPNGAGKTTLFSIVAGSQTPSQGHILIRGRSAGALAPHQVNRLGIARTFQSAQIFPDLSVLDVLVTAALAHCDRVNAFARALCALDEVGLSSRRDTKSHALTLADQRRLEIARALATEPRVILLDEVMAGLTAREVDFTLDLIRRLRARNISVVLIEHNIRAVMSVSQRIVVLDAGQVICAGAPDHVANDPRVIEAYLGSVVPANKATTMSAVRGSRAPAPVRLSDVAASRQTLLAVDGLAAGYGEFQVLHDVTLSVGEGEAVAILGANGVGKSTLLRAISGLVRPERGTIRFAGADLGVLPPHAIPYLGLLQVPESRHIFGRLSVRENLWIGGTTLARTADRNAMLDEILGLFPALRSKISDAAGSLSGGQQQMLAIGRALMSRPKMIMLDEPSLGLAPIVVAEVYEIIAQLVAKGLTILLVEQDIHLALKLVRRGYVLEQGKILLSGPSQELLDSDFIRRSYLGL